MPPHPKDARPVTHHIIDLGTLLKTSVNQHRVHMDRTRDSNMSTDPVRKHKQKKTNCHT
jgi:hypothetical protein